MHRLTGDQTYSEMGRILFESLIRHYPTEAGYASLRNVVTKETLDEMHSFCLAGFFDVK